MSSPSTTTFRNNPHHVICSVTDQEFLGWYDPKGQRINATDSSTRIYVKRHEALVHELFLKSVKDEDGGKYTCRGSLNSSTHQLFIQCKFWGEREREGENSVRCQRALKWNPGGFQTIKAGNRRRVILGKRVSFISLTHIRECGVCLCRGDL